MKKRGSLLNLGGIICLAAAVYCIYYVLLHDNMLPFSIPRMMLAINHCSSSRWHVLVVGLMPIYLAVVIFGASILGVYLGSALHRWLSRMVNQR